VNALALWVSVVVWLLALASLACTVAPWAAEEATFVGLREALNSWPRPEGLVADDLTYADMTTGPRGQRMTFEARRD
jgi:hypothetical protein